MQEIKTKNHIIIVSDEDYDRLSQFTWHVMKTNFNKLYARRWSDSSKNKKAVLMHREVLNAPEHSEVDHINHDTLDNRRDNLRLCTRQQNTQNRKSKVTEYKGVSFNKVNGKYHTQIVEPKTKKRLHLGDYDTPKQAGLVYDGFAKKLHKEFAYLNFPLDNQNK